MGICTLFHLGRFKTITVTITILGKKKISKRIYIHKTKQTYTRLRDMETSVDLSNKAIIVSR